MCRVPGIRTQSTDGTHILCRVTWIGTHDTKVGRGLISIQPKSVQIDPISTKSQLNIIATTTSMRPCAAPPSNVPDRHPWPPPPSHGLHTPPTHPPPTTLLRPCAAPPSDILGRRYRCMTSTRRPPIPHPPSIASASTGPAANAHTPPAPPQAAVPGPAASASTQTRHIRLHQAPPPTPMRPGPPPPRRWLARRPRDPGPCSVSSSLPAARPTTECPSPRRPPPLRCRSGSPLSCGKLPLSVCRRANSTKFDPDLN